MVSCPPVRATDDLEVEAGEETRWVVGESRWNYEN